MTGDRVVARRIAALPDPAVRQCLQTLFAFELENAELKLVHYSDFYDKNTRRFSSEWKSDEEAAE